MDMDDFNHVLAQAGKLLNEFHKLPIHEAMVFADEYFLQESRERRLIHNLWSAYLESEDAVKYWKEDFTEL
jgi:hypothetical protein